ncbi:ATP-binding protein [Acidimicrobiia bacterium EGI L10123]|uniref:ATP-binding protein n=1 Tax=Salinilacustrithrix flava TaxID=2957203 RepID=UPI003D7C30B5|nr:ATP-binding protein [Acidimicrobiia bacterium EGI L10123]
METDALLRLRVRVDEAIRRRTILVVTGRFGTGKSFGVARAVEERAPVHDVDVVWLEMQASTGQRDQWHELYYEIHGYYPAKSATIGDVIRMLKHDLAERPRVLVLDEAQEVHKQVSKQLRWLHEPKSSDFGLIFSGTPNLWHDLLPGAIRSRTGHHVKVKGLSDEDAVKLLPQFHPIFATADPDDLRRWNRTRARGSFRWWARILENAVDLLPHLDGKLTDRAMAVICADLPEGMS